MGSDPLCPDDGVPWSGVIDLGGTRRLALEYPVVGARTDVTTGAKVSTTLTSWSSSGVTNENLGSKANQTIWRSSIPIEGPVPSSGFLRLESEQ